ncbi:MAG: hypothetical protein LKF82_05195 [Acinetobacter populi]|jgi:hypothetical protein|uniref:hypothetical protein n=1 Tax=Acinetobacter populi TaxID=1582270 RepID=UPI0023565FED|nr:hypothetical protein [Acinetobacter populi]MCH4247222.1 hypothetical protein [Acinetobacter populi]
MTNIIAEDKQLSLFDDDQLAKFSISSNEDISQYLHGQLIKSLKLSKIEYISEELILHFYIKVKTNDLKLKF